MQIPLSHHPKNYRDRKAARTHHYTHFTKGWRQRNCPSCWGTGRCNECRGTGKVWRKTNIDALRAYIGRTLQYTPKDDTDDRVPHGITLRVYIRDTRTAMIQYIDQNGVFKTTPRRVALHYRYNAQTHTHGWCFTDPMTSTFDQAERSGSLFFLDALEPVKPPHNEIPTTASKGAPSHND